MNITIIHEHHGPNTVRGIDLPERVNVTLMDNNDTIVGNLHGNWETIRPFHAALFASRSWSGIHFVCDRCPDADEGYVEFWGARQPDVEPCAFEGVTSRNETHTCVLAVGHRGFHRNAAGESLDPPRRKKTTHTRSTSGVRNV